MILYWLCHGPKWTRIIVISRYKLGFFGSTKKLKAYCMSVTALKIKVGYALFPVGDLADA